MSDVKKFGKTAAEKDAEQSLICRQIVREIFSFGVTQPQMLKIIRLISLELEDRDIMLKVIKATETEQEKEPDEKIELLPQKTKIIV